MVLFDSTMFAHLLPNLGLPGTFLSLVEDKLQLQILILVGAENATTLYTSHPADPFTLGNFSLADHYS